MRDEGHSMVKGVGLVTKQEGCALTPVPAS